MNMSNEGGRRRQLLTLDGTGHFQPVQVDHGALWEASLDGVGQLTGENPDVKFVIEKIGLPNVGILLDFGRALFGGESPADSAQLAIDYGRLFGMDVNDNLRSWDDDMVAGTVHPIELACAAMADWGTRAGRAALHPAPGCRGATAMSSRSTAGSATNA
jgi:hypothetical protein